MIKKIFYTIVYSALLIVPTVSFIKFVWNQRSCSEPEQLTIKIKEILPHASDAFTQGFFVHDGYFYESFGQYGLSGRKAYKIGEEAALKLSYNPEDEFAEGMTRANGKIIQITWKDEVAHILDDDLIEQGTFKYSGEGWGLTHNDDSIIMSDGTDKIVFRSFEDFEVLKTLQVKEKIIGYQDHQAVKNLNELEFIEGEIFANIWMSDDIVTIDPQRGCVTRRINASSLWDHEDRAKIQSGGVLNGIAYHAELGHIYLTGKYWDHIYQVELEKLDSN